MSTQSGLPFRVEHVGSFVRPQRLMEGARRHRAGTISEAEFHALQDDAVREVVSFQEGLGLQSITDGEYRRRAWSTGFIDAVPGFGYREGTLGSFKTAEGGVIALAPSPYATQRLVRRKGIATDEFAFLKSAVSRGVPKITMPSPAVMHFFLGPRSVDAAVYPDIDVYFDDLIRIYQEEIADLVRLGCTYLQLDDTALPCLCDPSVQDEVRHRGEDPKALIKTYVRLINGAIRNRPAGLTVGIHLCRGNLKGAWMAEGGYGFIADELFNAIDVDAYFLEYDTPRAGDFEPLRAVPKNKTVVLGLVSTKTAKLEPKHEIGRRIDEAAKRVDLGQLCLSPQCGFSSVAGSGQMLTAEDTANKVKLMQAVAADVWGRA
jgi:5-methyltetrahydropteroyltriglutamate--homocysteine methyltransferase